VEVHYATDGWLTVGSGSMNLRAGWAVAGGPVPYKFLVPFFCSHLKISHFSFLSFPHFTLIFISALFQDNFESQIFLIKINRSFKEKLKVLFKT
jgi:hypothetical protein